MRTIQARFGTRLLVYVLAVVITIPTPLIAQQGGTVTTPTVVPELPVEIETELSPAGSLKQAPLWKELIQLLRNPYEPVVRRPGFGVTMPPLNVYPLDRAVQTGQPLRLRTSDGAISWDQPGPLFDPNEVVPVDQNNIPLALRTIIGSLETVFDDDLCPAPAGCLAVSNTSGHTAIPPDGTIVAVPALIGGILHELDPATGEREAVTELEAPINEEDFIKDRAAAEALGKALFWDMQVGSDGVQSCGSCHFHAGVDNRTRNQLNPGHLGGDVTLQVRGSNQRLVPTDFPFHKLANPDIPGEPLMNPSNVVSDANDVTSSMGVRFRQFVDIPVPGTTAFLPAVNGVRALKPDVGAAAADPIPAFQGVRRVEPRNTPTMHSAAFNFDNFWDGRARFHFNGGSVFGPSDPFFHIFVDEGGLTRATNVHFREDLAEENPEAAEQPVRIKFSSLASQAVGPPLSDFEMSFAGRNWAKIGKKLLQAGVTPLANQLVATDDSVLGRYSNQNLAPGRPGLNITYSQLIALAFNDELWSNTNQHLRGCFTDGRTPECPPGTEADPFDSYVLRGPFGGAAAATNTNRFTQKEANFSTFFGLAVQAYEQLLIPDNSPFDQFMDANPLAGNGVGQPGEQGTLPPDQVRTLVTGSPTGTLRLVPGFGEDELFGFDIFAGANLTAALAPGSRRNPAGVGSNPFLRTGRCMICHLGPEQSDHTVNVNHGLIISDTEIEFPTPPTAPEPTGPFAVVSGFLLEEEVEEAAQDGVEVENRNFAVVDDPNTPWDDRQIGVPNGIAFQDNGIYNLGLRPTAEDISRGGDDPFGWPLALSALALKNLAGQDYEPCDTPEEAAAHPTACALENFNPADGFGGGLFEESGNDATYPGTGYTLQSINPGLEMEPAEPQMPEYMATWLNNLPAGENHPLIDELAFAPNTITEQPPVAEFGEILFGADLHCGTYDPAQFGDGPPNFGWGPRCPNTQSAVPNNNDAPLNGTFPFVNRVARDGAFKAPQLRNVELSGPYFHTGSYLTLRQVVDFYLRGGDFPVTNAENRDPNVVNIREQAFGFGTTIGLPPQFLEGVPDTITQYGRMPDTGAATPEYATQEDAANSLVKLLISMTDPRVKFERAPFDRPEMFVPVDGLAPDNVFGREQLLLDGRFRHVPAVGAGGRPDALANFMCVASTSGPGLDHFDRVSTGAGCDESSGDPGDPGAGQSDLTAPSVELTAPANLATVFGRAVTLSATASDNVRVSRVDFFVGDRAVGTDTTATDGVYSFVWNSTLVPDNTETVITAVAYDAASNSATSLPAIVNVSNTGLVASFDFDEPSGNTVQDSAVGLVTGDGANTGTFNAGVVRLDGGLLFNGVSGLVTVPDAASLDLDRTTLSAWVKPSALSGWNTVVLKEHTEGLVYGLYARTDVGGPGVAVRTGGTEKNSRAFAGLTVGEWHHIAGVYDGAALRVYVDGVRVQDLAVSGAINDSARPLFIGGNSFWGEYFAGVIDDVKVYNRGLSSSEVEALAAGGGDR